MNEKPIRRKAASHKSTKEDVARARSLRNDMSPVERKFWSFLVEQADAAGFKFRRQHPIHPYIADFVCLSVSLIVELDGDSHDNQVAHDLVRDAYLRQKGYDVMRFANHETLVNAEGVVQTILKACFDKAHK